MTEAKGGMGVREGEIGGVKVGGTEERCWREGNRYGRKVEKEGE